MTGMQGGNGGPHGEIHRSSATTTISAHGRSGGPHGEIRRSTHPTLSSATTTSRVASSRDPSRRGPPSPCRGFAMPSYRRNFVAGGTFFFTVVTHDRRPILTSPIGRSCLRGAIRQVRLKRPFNLVAIVLIPDHLHAVWTLARATETFPHAGHRSRKPSPEAIYRQGAPKAPSTSHGFDAASVLSGNGDPGSIRAETRTTSRGASITFIGIRSSTDLSNAWRTTLGRRFIVSLGWVNTTPTGGQQPLP